MSGDFAELRAPRPKDTQDELPSTEVLSQLQFTHLEKLYGYLPGMIDALPAIYGLTANEYAAARAVFAERSRSAAEELLSDPDFWRKAERLPFLPGQRILAVGDSVTDDLQSWAEILQHVLVELRGEKAPVVVNAGLSAHTSAMILRRWPAALHPAPDWILCALGCNDVTRVAAGKPQVGLAESVANLRELHRVASEMVDASWVWLTPVAVDEERVATHPLFRFGRSSWRNADLEALADAIRKFPEPVVDVMEAFRGQPAELLGPDGVHPSLGGQQAIVRAVVDHISA